MDLAGGVCSFTAHNIIQSVVLEVDKDTCLSLSNNGPVKVAQGICREINKCPWDGNGW
jgi:hypothetical protein